MSDRPPRSADGADCPDADHERLRHLAYVVLSPALGSRRRAQLADELAQGALAEERGYDSARDRLVQRALHSGHRPPRLTLPSSGGTTSSATERALAAMMPAARAAYVLIRLEDVSSERTEALLRAAGVHDPTTAVGVAERSGLPAADVRALTVPDLAVRSRGRLVAVGAVVLVVAVAAAVIAVTASGNNDPAAPVSVETPADPAALVKAAKLDKDLARILRRLDQELARKDSDPDEIIRLRTLRKAVIAEQDRLRR